MKTMFDFLTYIKGVEYLIAISAIALYVLFWEALKPKPFKPMLEQGRDDLNHLKEMGYRGNLRTLGKVAAAPFIGLAYVVALPFGFLYALGSAGVNGLLNLIGKEAVFGWRPTEAYLSGKKKNVKKEEKEESETQKDESK
ncbi:MAG: hypothetical protein HZA16_12110 [Nitrospirae bacterium]|nr:hypothetical protein [Nitrospirota bacterium]